MSAAALLPPVVCLPPDLAAHGQRLMHQQCFLWGRDIVRPAGNLLTAFGLARVPDAEGKGRRYDGTTVDGAGIALWGSGAAYLPADGLAIHVNRYRFLPRVLVGGVGDAAFYPDDLVLRDGDEADSCGASRSLAALCRWVARYEAWVADSVEAAHREEALRWAQAVSSAGELASAWETLADDIELLERS